MFLYEFDRVAKTVKVRLDSELAGMAYLALDGNWYALVMRRNQGLVHLDGEPRARRKAIRAIEADVFSALVGAH